MAAVEHCASDINLACFAAVRTIVAKLV